MRLKIVGALGMRQGRIEQFLHLPIPSFGIMEDLTNELDYSLNPLISMLARDV